ncbi:hypothetical protein MKW92_009739 [Papaver armeniacum]|nr:hypothetical protein MKW92_009739 [Papaver armeniacum]
MHTIPSRLMDSLTTDLRNMNALAKADYPYFNKLIRILTGCSRDLTPQEFLHYDVIVHRFLAATLGIYKLPPIFQGTLQLTSIADSKLYWEILEVSSLSCIK